MWTLRGSDLRLVMCTSCSVATIAASAPVAHSACYYNKSAAACSRERGGGCPHPQYRRGGRPPPPPVQERGGGRPHPHPRQRPRQRLGPPPPRSREARPRFVLLQTSPLHHAPLPIYLRRYYLTFIYTYLCNMYICILYSYLQSCMKRKSSYSMIL